MKKLLVVLLGCTLSCKNLYASPYFRLIDPSHPIVSAGVLFDPKDIMNTGVITNIALVTHSTRDGTIVPDKYQGILAPEDWVPVQVGGGYAAGNGVISAGTSVNLAPAVASALLRKVNASSSPILQGAKQALSCGYSTASGSNIGFAFGPTLVAFPIRNGVILPINKWTDGSGFGRIVNNALRWQVQGAWKF